MASVEEAHYQTPEISMMQEEQNQLFDQQKDKPTGISKTRKVAASFAVLIVAGLLLILFMKQQYSDQVLAESYLAPYPDRITAIGDRLNTQIEAAMQAYNFQDYKKARDLFSALPGDYAQMELIKLYRAISSFKLEENQSAIAILEKLTENPSLYNETARWYLALSYLQNGEKEQAQELLQQIVENKSYQYENAIELIEDLDSFWRK